jgi:hypothetical protein
MKVRCDFVTNSSSSSFIISTKDVEYDFLVNEVLRDFHLQLKRQWLEDESDEEINGWYNPEKILGNPDDNISLMIKSKSEIENEDDCYGYWYKESEEERKERENKNDEKFYVIDNNCTCRFDWDIVRKVFTDKYNIPWNYGYCD